MIVDATCQTVAFLGLRWPTPVLPVVGALLGGTVGALLDRLWMTRGQRKELEQKQFENATGLGATLTDRRNDFTAAITKSLRKTKPSMDDIHEVMKTGDAYFETLRGMADAVLQKKVSSDMCEDYSHKIAEALEKSLPAYYDTLGKLCNKTGVQFEGRLTEANYRALFKVADEYAPEAAERVRERLTAAGG